MKFTGEQLTAILKLGTLMIAADGKVTEEEKNSLLGELLSFNVPPEKAALMFIATQEMETTEPIMIISNLNLEQKKYVTGYLAMLMTSDGDIDDSELKLWRVISSICRLPKMTIEEAVSFWTTH